MTPERWQHIEGLVQAALEQPTAARSVYVRQACAEDADLREEVEALLAAYQVEDEFLEVPPAEIAAAIIKQETTEFLPGYKLGRYELQRVLGRGGMGTVYLARDTQLGRQVALKLLSSAAFADAKRVRRFHQEARAVSALNHPNILTLHELGEVPNDDGGTTHFLTTEYVEGRTLRALLIEGGLTLGETLDMAIQTASALAAAHAAGIIHRDIKPENLMRRADGLVKVLDFGIAKLTQHQTIAANQPSFSTVNTNPGLIMGTVNYMSPEQLHGLALDPRSDLFSFGVVLYEMLTGKAPFTGAPPGEVLFAILNREPLPITHYAPALPASLQRIVSHALAKDREQRCQRATEILADLKELKQELELSAHLKRASGTPVGQVSLSLRVGSTVPDKSDHGTDDAPTITTAPITKPSFFRRLVSPSKFAVIALSVFSVLMLVLAGWAFYRYQLIKEVPPIRSIAVLPFVNANGNPQVEYLSDGLTENLMQSLQGLPDLRVIARSTVFTYKGREADPRQIGKDLAVEAIVIGRVQSQGERLIIQTEMVNAADGARLWGGRYEHPTANLQVVQAEIAREISTMLQANLRPQERRQLMGRRITNSEAYQLYLQGRYLHFQMARENFSQVLDLYHRAVLADPRFALAYSGIAHVYADASSQYLPPAQAMPQAKQAALTALSLEGNLPEAHLALGLVKFWGDWDWQGAEEEFKRTLTLNPNNSEAHGYYASLLAVQKRFDEAINEIRQAEELDPVSARYSASVAGIFYVARKYDRAEAKARQMLALYPQGAGASNIHSMLGQTLLQQGRLTEALAAFRQAIAHHHTATHLAWLAHVQAKLGQTDEARAILREIRARSQREQLSPITIARIYLGLGDNENALIALRKAFDDHSDHILRINVDPLYDSLRKDPRFLAIVRGVGLHP